VLLVLSKFNRILEIDFENRCVVAQPGVTNLAISKAVEHRGFYYAPGTRTAIMAGGTWRPNLQSSQLAPFTPGTS